jgi:hypothetical protein
MADAVTTQQIDGAHNVILFLNNNSDGTGETLVRKIDVTTLIPNPRTTLRLWRAAWGITGNGQVVLYWEGTPNRVFLVASAAGTEFFYGKYGGIKNDAVTPTGNVLLSTGGFVVNNGYHLMLEFKKGGTR